jgi:hypothetical protein
MYTTVDDEGKTSRIVNMAADLKVVIGTLAALGALIVTGAAWFNGHVQAQAIKALGTQLSEDGSDVQNAFKAILDERAEEIESNLRHEMEKLQAEHKELRRHIWRATDPDRRADGAVNEEDMPDG